MRGGEGVGLGGAVSGGHPLDDGGAEKDCVW